jgi:hypothetical protein
MGSLGEPCSIEWICVALLRVLKLATFVRRLLFVTIAFT